MKPVAEMTDAEIVAAVRTGTFALVPVSDGAVVGEITLDDWECIEGQPALMMPLTPDAARFVAPQVI